MTSETFFPLFGAWRDVLWPDFGEHDGCVFCRKMDAAGEAVYRDWMAQTGGDRRRVEAVRFQEVVLRVVAALRADWELRADQPEWENPDLGRFLRAMQAWTEDMGERVPASASWRTFAEMFYAARIYE